MLLSLAVSERLLVCIRVVEEFGLVEEGIFRKAGPKMEVDLLSTILVDGESAFSVVERDIGVPEAAAAAGAAEEEEEENEETASAAAEPFVSSASTPLEAQLRNVTTVHSVAGALKRVLRNHHPLLCCELYASWVSGARDWEVARDEELPVIPPLLRQCAARLPPVHLAVLERLVHCVGAVLDHGENRMTMKSVAITLGINILHSGDLMALPDIPAIENVLNALLDVAQLSNDRRKGVANEEAIGYEETDDVQPGPLAAIARTMSKVLKMDGIAVVDDASVAAFYAAKSGSDSDDDDTYSAPRKLKSKSASEVMSEIRHELKAGRKFIKREISSAALSAVTDEKSEALQQKRAAHKSAMALAHAASAARQQQSQQRRVLARKLKKRNRKASSNRFDANFAWWEEEEGLAEERLAQTDVVVQLLRTPVALPTVGEIHVVEDDAKLKPKVKPKGAAASPPSRHRPAGAAPAPPVPPAARPKGAAPPPPVPATPSLTDMLRIAPDALLVRLLEYKLDVDAAQEKSARNILRLTELSRALDEHWHGKTEHYFGCDDLSRRPSHTVGGVGAAAAAAAAAAGASPAAKPKAKLKTAPSLKMKIKDVKREVKSVVAGGAPSESMMTTLLRNRGRRQTLMRWGLAQLPAVKAAFAQQYECQSRWIALHAEAESAFADALLAKQDAIESMIEHYDLRSIVHAAGNGGGSGGGSKSNAVQRLMSSTFHKVGSMQQRAKVTSSLAKVRSALTRGKPGAEKASAAAGISTAGGSRNVSILTVERRFFASLEDMREAVQLGKASHHQHSVKIASSAVAAVAPKSAPPGEYAAEAASLRGRIEAANAQVVGLQQTLMPRSFEERAASLKTSVEVFMHTKACIAAAKTARITPPPLAEGEDAECEARKVAVSVSRARGKASAVNDASDQMKRQVRGDGKTAAAIAQFCAVVLDERTTHGRWAWALIDECRTTLNAGGGGGGDATAAAGADAEDEYDDGMPQKSYTDMLITFCTGRLAKGIIHKYKMNDPDRGVSSLCLVTAAPAAAGSRGGRRMSSGRAFVDLQQGVSAAVREMIESAVFGQLHSLLLVVDEDSPDATSDNDWCTRLRWLQNVPPICFGIGERYLPQGCTSPDGTPPPCCFPHVVHLLSALGDSHVPSQMVALTLQAFSSLQFAAVANGVESYGRENRTKEVILMADDLLPLLAYCAVHAADLSGTCADATFAKKMGLSPTNGATGLACPARMQNFVDRFQEMDGEFAYYATTLQIAAQWVISIKEPADLPVPPNATANKDGETDAEVPPLSTVEEQQ